MASVVNNLACLLDKLYAQTYQFAKHYYRITRSYLGITYSTLLELYSVTMKPLIGKVDIIDYLVTEASVKGWYILVKSQFSKQEK